MTTSFPDFQSAPNQGARPDLYELENQALDPDGVVLAAMRELGPVGRPHAGRRAARPGWPRCGAC
jgi:hypothetical protein